MQLVEVGKIFLSILPEATFHYEAVSKPDQYIVWAEDGQSGRLDADNKMQEQVIQGTVDYFTKTEFDPIVDQIQKALNDAENIQWELSLLNAYEEDTGYLHSEWIWEVTNSVG